MTVFKHNQNELKMEYMFEKQILDRDQYEVVIVRRL